MNQLLQTRYNELGPSEVFQLKAKLSGSPRALLLLELLEKRRDKKINIADAVDFIYKDESENFEILRNRFFKLRKQVLGLFSDNGNTTSGSGIELLPMEERLYRSRKLIGENHFQLAKNDFKDLIKECKQLNIFEILPDAMNQLIYCNMAMNVIKENEKWLDELSEYSALLHDFRQAQVNSRRIYHYVLSQEYHRIPGLLRQMRRMAIQRAAYPRFKIFYHFTVVSYTIGIPGFSIRSHARHLTSLKKLLTKYPGMPAGYYEPNSPALMQFALLMAEGTQLFMKGDVASCYQYFKESWDIMERTPNLRLRKADSYFMNRIAIEVATGRFKEALKTAEELIEFQKEQRQEEKRLKGYAEMAIIYSYGFPHLKCPNPEFLLSQLKTYLSILRKNESPLIWDGLSTLAIFQFMNEDWKATKKIMEEEQARAVFSKMKLDVYNRLLVMSPTTSNEQLQSLKSDIEKQLHKAVSSDMVFSLRRALNFLKMLEERKRELARGK